MPQAKYRKEVLARCRQGDIFRNIQLLERVETGEEEIEVATREISYCVLLSQDCDLEHDFNSRNNGARPNDDKILPTILLSPGYLSEQFRAGTHLQDQSLKMRNFNAKEFEKVKGNQLYRYHYLPTEPDLQVPELVVDFKHFFTVPRDDFYRSFKNNYIASLEDLFREDFSNRFAYYLSRIGLPEPAAVD